MGAVTRPGEYHLAKDDRVKQSVLGLVLNLANGFTRGAQLLTYRREALSGFSVKAMRRAMT